jgi:hypothetical protein
MVLRLSTVLGLPPAERNTLLLAAGYAPVFGETVRETAAPKSVQHALDFVLRQQEPYPALVIDGDWNIVMRNAASARLFAPFRERCELSDDRAANAMHVTFHPKGLRRFIVDWEAFAGPLIQSLHREIAQGVNPAAPGLLDELLSYPGVPAGWQVHGDVGAPSPLLTMHLRLDNIDLTYLTTLTAFALPHDEAWRRLKVECFYPADAATAAAARRLAATD